MALPTPYGICVALGCAVALGCLHRRRRRMGLPGEAFWGAMWTLLLGGILGAKLAFLVLGWEHFARGELDFFADFRTGFVFSGGLVGGSLAGWLFAQWKGLDFLAGADSFAFALPIGHSIGRVGCFLQGCCQGIPGHAVQLYEAAGLCAIAWIGSRILRQVDIGDRPRGSAFRCYLLAYGCLRFALDPLRGDGRPERFFGISHQQGVALALIAIASAWSLLRTRAPAIPSCSGETR